MITSGTELARINDQKVSDRILKVSRTIADLAGKEQIESEHISEAIQPALLARHSPPVARRRRERTCGGLS